MAPAALDADETAEDLPAIDEPDSMLERALIVSPEGVVANPKAAHDSEPPTLMKDDVPSLHPPTPRNGANTPSDAPASKSGNTIATRLGELAKDALLAGDNVSLEKWVDNLRASGESPLFTERMRAMARIVRGDIGDGLRVLRRMRSQLDPKDHAARCQTSLAMGIALSVAGRPQEALLEGMDALARARQIGDHKGADACIAFLAKLFTSVGRAEDAARLRSP